MKTRSVIVEGEGITVSKMAWRLLKRQPEGYVERVYAMNPGIADLGPVLPVGTIVEFPLENIPAAPQPVVVRLWD